MLKKYKSIINIGDNPTFNAESITVESYIFDYAGVYSEPLSVNINLGINDIVSSSDKLNNLDNAEYCNS